MDDPLLVEVQSEDYWYEGYNMRTGARGIFPAYYAIEVARDAESYKDEGEQLKSSPSISNLKGLNARWTRRNCASESQFQTQRSLKHTASTEFLTMLPFSDV